MIKKKAASSNCFFNLEPRAVATSRPGRRMEMTDDGGGRKEQVNKLLFASGASVVGPKWYSVAEKRGKFTTRGFRGISSTRGFFSETA